MSAHTPGTLLAPPSPARPASDPAAPLLIVNPRSGGGLSEAAWARAARAIAEGLGPFEARMTERAHHARTLAADAARAGKRLVIAVGGDGTLNEVVNGLMDAGAPEETAFALIPRGTGGDFRRTIDGAEDLCEAARRIREGTRRKIDVGRVRYKGDDGLDHTCHFLNVSSFGFSAAVANRANRSSKRLGPRAAFLGATVRTLLGHDNVEVEVTLDEGESRRRTCLLGAVGNGRYFGGGMKICPEAQLDSGHFQVVLVGDLGVGTIATRIHRLYAGTHLSIDQIEHATARRIHVTPLAPDGQIRLEVDGETPGFLPATWEILPGALNLVL